MSSAKRLSFLKKRIKEAHRYMSEMETDLVLSKYREDQSERKILVHEWNMLQNEILSLTAEYNEIVKSTGLDSYSPLVPDFYYPLILDEETDRMKPIRIDIETRLKKDAAEAEEDGVPADTQLVGETENYLIYYSYPWFLRMDKTTGVFVLLEEGRLPAAVYNGWLYWNDDGLTIDSKRFIRRISLDGKRRERYAWLSDKRKFIVRMRRWGRFVIIDSVESMCVIDDILRIRVFRDDDESQPYEYYIDVTIAGEEQQISRSFISGGDPAEFSDKISNEPIEIL